MADMNRRNVLLGLGTAAAGSGIVFGSGAFTTVEAERSFDVSVDTDADAVIGLDTAADGDDLVTESDFVRDGPGATAFEINLDEDFGDLNPGSEFRFDGTITIQNNTDEDAGTGDGAEIVIGLRQEGDNVSDDFVQFVDPGTETTELSNQTNLTLSDNTEEVETELVLFPEDDDDTLNLDSVVFVLEEFNPE